MTKQIIRKKAHINIKYCVACGVCQKECPLEAISIYKGIYAKVNFEKCIGCSKCAKKCPASIIEIKTQEELKSE